jgi:hypothetical protein
MPAGGLKYKKNNNGKKQASNSTADGCADIENKEEN